jgi:hypothetical protein
MGLLRRAPCRLRLWLGRRLHLGRPPLGRRLRLRQRRRLGGGYGGQGLQLRLQLGRL